MTTTFTVERNIESLEEIVNEVPVGTTKIECINKGLKSLKGIERLPSVTALVIWNNQITSLEGLAGSIMSELNISDSQITSLKGLCGSAVTELYIFNNQITSLEGLAGSIVSKLYIVGNQKITSLEGLRGSAVTELYMCDNPCYRQFQNQFGGSVEKVKEYYNQFADVSKDPEFD